MKECLNFKQIAIYDIINVYLHILYTTQKARGFPNPARLDVEFAQGRNERAQSLALLTRWAACTRRAVPCACVSVLQYVAVCCSVLQCAAVCLQCVAVCCSLLQCAAVCLRCVAVYCSVLRSVGQLARVELCHVHTSVCCSMLQYVAVYCSLLQCAAVCCSVLQCVVAMRCSALQCIAV